MQLAGAAAASRVRAVAQRCSVRRDTDAQRMQLAGVAAASGAHAGPCARESRDVASAAAARGAFRRDGCASGWNERPLRAEVRAATAVSMPKPRLLDGARIVGIYYEFIAIFWPNSDRIISMRTLFES